MTRWSLQRKLTVVLFGTLLVGAAAHALLAKVPGYRIAAITVAAVLGWCAAHWVAKRTAQPLLRVVRAVTGTVASYRDGDYSLSLVVDRDDEIGNLLKAHNELGATLRDQRSALVQREMLLDSVTQNSPVALVLIDSHRRVAYANLAARHLLNDGRVFIGRNWSEILEQSPAELGLAAARSEDCLFTAHLDGAEETFHLSTRSFRLQGRPHVLYSFKHLTRELSRQEVATWKKLIRVLSHEINNSLAPIASLAQTGVELVRRGEAGELNATFAAIGERAEHLNRFLQGYSQFARLPAPRLQPVEWASFVDEIVRQLQCRVAGSLPCEPAWLDRAQVGQALINLLTNAHQAGGPLEDIELAVTRSGSMVRIEVRDRGPGMTEQVMAQALLPFYSTKRSGTGLGLALAREIVEAHGGYIQLNNREGGGLCVTLSLSARAHN
jgi:nitrogen fixation/metabolism regulation signal transduction histidine kinase